MTRMAALASLLAAGAVVAGCGGGAGDELAISVAGGPAGSAAHTVVVTGDGRASCDRGALREIPNPDLLAALAVVRDAQPLTSTAKQYPAGRLGGRHFTLRDMDGTTSWYETSAGLPAALGRAELLELKLEREVC